MIFFSYSHHTPPTAAPHHHKSRAHHIQFFYVISKSTHKSILEFKFELRTITMTSKNKHWNSRIKEINVWDGKYEDAIEAYTKALELDEKNYLYFCGRSAARIWRKTRRNWKTWKTRGNVWRSIRHMPRDIWILQVHWWDKTRGRGIECPEIRLSKCSDDDKLKAKARTCEKIVKQKSLYYILWRAATKQSEVQCFCLFILWWYYWPCGSHLRIRVGDKNLILNACRNLCKSCRISRTSEILERICHEYYYRSKYENLMLCAIIHFIPSILATAWRHKSYVHVATANYKILVSRAPSLARRHASLGNLIIVKLGGSAAWSNLPFNTKRIDFVSGCVTTHLQLWFWDSFAAQILLAKQGSSFRLSFWQYIRMSVMLEQTRATAKHFTSVFPIDTKVAPSPIRGPSVVHNAYLKLRSALITFSSPLVLLHRDSNSSSSAGGLFGIRVVA